MRRVALLSLLTLCLYLPAFSQQAANATLTGTITDPRGAVVSGASVTATHKATGVKRDTTTNDSGLYVLSNMPPGDYELKVAAQGFSTKVSKADISLIALQAVLASVLVVAGSFNEIVSYFVFVVVVFRNKRLVERRTTQ